MPYQQFEPPNMIIKPAQNGYLNPNWDSSTEKGAVLFKHLIIPTVMRGCGNLVFYFPIYTKKKVDGAAWS